MFEAFPKLTRFSHDWTVTEKIDGTNTQILILPKSEIAFEEDSEQHPIAPHFSVVGDVAIAAGSRNRWLTTGKGDNHGFAGFVHSNAEEIIEKLGEGRHFGEWYGNGIQRGYGLKEKRFALFNAGRWNIDTPLPDRFDVVPVLYKGYLEQSALFDTLLAGLKRDGSHIAPGFMDPEGIVMYHGPSRTLFKKTFDYDEEGKWAEKQVR